MDSAIIFIHSGIYLTEYLFVDTNVIMIGAAPGNVIDNVIIERGTESTITFVEGAKEAYLGYVSLKVQFISILCRLPFCLPHLLSCSVQFSVYVDITFFRKGTFLTFMPSILNVYVTLTRISEFFFTIQVCYYKNSIG